MRPLAICVFVHQGCILVAEGYDPIKQEAFYRPLGGAIEFGEYSHHTLIREIREEIKAEITSLHYLGTLENIFNYNGKPGHEIVQVYDGKFIGLSIYSKTWSDGIEEEDGNLHFRAAWVPICDLNSKQSPPLYPDVLYELLTNSILKRLAS